MHQWCYGSLPLSATRRFIDLISHPENAAIISAEIRALDGKYGPCGREAPRIPEYSCPYTTSLLGCAWTTDLGTSQSPYFSGSTLETASLMADMGCWESGKPSSHLRFCLAIC